MQNIIKSLIKIKVKDVTIEEESKTLEYQETMDLDIENIASTSQNIWRSIYKAMHDGYFKVVKFFPTEFLNQCKKIRMNLRIHQMKSKQLLKKMALAEGLYAQVVLISRRNLNDFFFKIRQNKLTSKENQQEPKNWFDLDHEWLKEYCMTREPDFYKTISN